MSQISQLLFETNSVIIKEKPPLFKWASGIESPIYCDNRKLLSHPSARKLIVDKLCKKVLETKCCAVAGVATAGIPWASFVAFELNLPLIYVRNSAKEHGRANTIEGDYSFISNVVLIEDLISTGNSSICAVKSLQESGIATLKVLSIFSYNLSIAHKNFNDINMNVESLENLENILEEDSLTINQKQLVQDFICLQN